MAKALLLVIVCHIFFCMQESIAKPHHRNNYKFIETKVYKRSAFDGNGGKKSDYYGYGNDYPSNEASQSFLDMSQPQGPYDTEEHHKEIDETAEHLSHVKQKDLDDAYNYVNSEHFDFSRNGNTESRDKTKQPSTEKTGVGRSLVHPEYDPSSQFNNNDYRFSKAGLNEPVERLNPNEFEKDINLGSQADTMQYNQNFYNLDNEIPNENDAKKSGVPSSKSHIPPNATHPDGVHRHYTTDEIITHRNNDANYTGVSRYPPYITSDGKSVYGPPSNTDSNTTTKNGVHQNSLQQQQKLKNSTNQSINQHSEPFNNNLNTLTKLIPDISQITSAGLDTYPMFSNQPTRTTNASIGPPEKLSVKNSKPNTGKQSSLDPIAQVGGGNDANHNTRQKASSELSYPVTLIDLGQDLQAALANASKEQNSPEKHTQNLNGRNVDWKLDDPRCKSYTIDICYQAWMQRHCPIMCSKKERNDLNTSNEKQLLVNQTQKDNKTLAKNYTEEETQGNLKPHNLVTQYQKQLQSPEKQQDSCQVPSFSGNSNGACCSFPFIYNGYPQYSCVMLGNNGYPWCATTSNYDQDRLWGQCGACLQPGCPTLTTPMTTIPTTTPRTTTPRTTTIKPVEKCYPWSSWNNCSKECGFGEQIRTMECFLGDEKKVYNETKQCFLKDCQPECDPWSNYTVCSKTCGGGFQTHRRNCSFTDNIHTNITEVTESRLCNTEPCPPVCSAWSTWSNCSSQCGVVGIQRRERNCTWEDLDRIINVVEHESRTCMLECPYTCTVWSDFSECTKTCGGGEQQRQRECHSSSGLSLEVDKQICNNIPCEPPFCGEWSAFTDCTVSCDGGIKMRWRTCGGNYDEENVTCNEQPCFPTNHTDWTMWSPCSETCDKGVQYRSRNVTIYFNGSQSYTAPEEESRLCPNLPLCPVEAVCQEWGNWSDCSATCNGMQTRVRHCKNTTNEYDELQARPCNTNPCPSNCTGWSEWSDCSLSCGGGSQQRYRTCQTFQQEIETRACNEQPCPEITIPVVECVVTYLSFDIVDEKNKVIYDEGPYGNHATYTNEIDFVNANYSCGNATNIKHSGEIYFNASAFKNIPQEGITIAAWIYPGSVANQVSLFSTSASNSAAENINLDINAGKISWNYNDPVSGKQHFAVATETIIQENDWAHIAVTYNGTTGIATIVVNGVEVISKQSQGGALVPNWDLLAGIAASVYENDYVGLIDELYIYNCSLTISEIIEVANTCRKNTGDGCPSPLLGICPPCDNCMTTTEKPPVEPINGNYGEWSTWGLCSESCGGGEKIRTRECNNPEPQYGGLECSEQIELGNDTETSSCNEAPCPVLGVFCPWSNWTECNVPCGPGSKTRSRTCNCPAPQFGGNGCDGPETETASCKIKNCPVHGNFTNWTPWSPCSVTCGDGTQLRTRECSNPTPKYGGNDCKKIGDYEEIVQCFNENQCPVDGNWAEWSTWSQCSRSCGDGFALRNRSCSGPHPSNGGKICSGNATELMSCKDVDCCAIPYKRIGCFKDPGQDPRPLPELLFTDRDPKSNLYTGKPVHGLDFQGYITDLICRCAKSAKDRKYTHFSIQDFGECLSGANAGTTYNKFGNETMFRFRPESHPWIGCMDVDHDICSEDSLTCVGMEDTNFVYGLENVNPIDGNYTNWSTWSTCSLTCGNGTQYRQRECSKPRPTFGGKNCSRLGPSMEIQDCVKNCPVNGNWGQWSEFGPCSQTCNAGEVVRQRFCDSPAPSDGGKACNGDAYQKQECILTDCPKDCGWSTWLQWSDCSVTCGLGTQLRQRTPDNPPASAGGAECVGEIEDVRNCTAPVDCPIDGGYTDYTPWASCSKTCGGGLKERTRTCTNPVPQNGGKDCIALGLGGPKQQIDCNTACCPIDGQYSDWTSWSPCDVTCGNGTHTRARKCDNPFPSCGGKNCSVADSNFFEIESCEATINCPVPGGWSLWGSWSACSKTCGYGGSQSRERACTNPSPQYNGLPCFGEVQEIRNCSSEVSCCGIDYQHLGCFNDLATTPSSKPLPMELFDDQENIDLDNWDEYLDELVCKCAQKSLDASFSHFGVEALGKCLSGENVENTYSRYGSSTSCVTTGGNPRGDQFSQCVNTAKPCAGMDKTVYVYGLKNVPPRDGNYTEWSQWSDCNVPCGPGNRTRYRTCTNPTPSHGGKTCIEQGLGLSEETDSCPLVHCPEDCVLSNWTPWTNCSVPCGNGVTERTRSVLISAKYGGKNCSDIRAEVDSCNLGHCPVDGNWTLWGQWGIWSVTCGNATRMRTRTCTNPSPAYGGKSCSGSSQETEFFKLEDCPVDGNWCSWSSWSECSASCGLGNSNRNRVCACHEPVNGGSPCLGPEEECKDCNITGCPVNGNYSPWTLWTSCDHSCGNGTKSRSRSCNNPAPVFGGENCIAQNLGESEELEFCILGSCPVDGGWSGWSIWTACSQSCGEGRQTRERSCSNPIAQEGGIPCVGEDVQARVCKQTECCQDPYEAIGCFQDAQIGTKAFSEMMNTRKEDIGFVIWEDILMQLICDCAARAKTKHYTHFGISNFGECWSGPNVKDTYAVHGKSNQCISMTPLLGSPPKNLSAWSQPTPNPGTYETCIEGSLQCAGPVGSVYVYSVNTVSEGDGGYSGWSSWGNCSKPCNGGLRTAYRTCTNPYPLYGGKDCTQLGEETQSEACNEFMCPVDGNWATWTIWSGCSVSCGSGLAERSRNCSAPSASNGGKMCNTGENGTLTEFQKETVPCKMPDCPSKQIGSDNFAWGEWSQCSVSCGLGKQNRVRNCLKATVDNPCPCPKVESRTCNVTSCPKHGYWTEWSSYSECSMTCGCGNQTRTRTCNPPQFGGLPCEGVGAEHRDCNCAILCPRNGNYSEWTSWSACDVTCSNGTITRRRSCNNPTPANGGLNCFDQNLGNETETDVCILPPCEIPCFWSNWEQWSSCSVNCGYGTQVRVRNPNPLNGNCTGAANETKSCYVECCDVPYTRLGCYQKSDKTGAAPIVIFNYSDAAHNRYSDWNSYLPQLVCQCAQKAKDAKYTHFALHDLGVCLSGPNLATTFNNTNYYTTSSKCVSRTTDPPSDTNNTYTMCQPADQHCAGSDDNTLFVYGLDNIIPVNCGYTQWSKWTSCSASCGNGTQDRTRHDNNPPLAFGGLPCTESLSEVQTCYIEPCPISGNWSPWGSFTMCTASCGGGTRTHQRECNAPPPQFNGASCVGNDTETEICNTIPCMVDGNWGDWSNWTQCSETCGAGFRQRTRECDNPAPEHGGKPCIGGSVESTSCFLQPCHYNLTEWGQWSPCNVTCGSGYRSRSRQCPQQPCYGDLIEIEVCHQPACLKGCNKSVDLGFLVDFSLSVKPYFADYTKKFINETTMLFDLSKDHTHFAYLPYSTVPSVNLSSDIWFKNPLIDTINAGDKSMQKDYLEYVIGEEQPIEGYVMGHSYLNRGLRGAADYMFTAKNGMRENVEKILILISDGKQKELNAFGMAPEESVKSAADALKEKGVTIISVVIGSNLDMNNLNEVSSDPSYILREPLFEDIHNITPLILNITCNAHWSSWGNWTTCSATCGDGIKERTRKCKGGKPGEGLCVPSSAVEEVVDCNEGPCIPACKASIDLGYLVDYSASVQNAEEVQYIKDFITGSATTFDISVDATHFSFIPFSTLPGDYSANQWFSNPVIDRITTGDKAAQLAYLDEIIKPDPENSSYPRGQTFTYRAMELANTKMWSIDYGMRKNVPKYMVILSDGLERSGFEDGKVIINSLDILQEIKNKAVNVIAVAVGTIGQNSVVNKYPSKPEWLFNFTDYNEVKRNLADIAKALCPETQIGSDAVITTPSPTTAATTLGPTTAATTASTTAATSPVPNTDPFVCHRAIDVVFLVDGSKSIVDYWEKVKDFLENILDRFEIGKNATQVAIVLYSSTPRKEIDLNMGADKNTLNWIIRNMKPLKESTRIDLALEFVPEKILHPGHGNREEITDVVVLLTDGKSDEGSTDLQIASQKMKDNGVQLISVGLGNDTSMEELQKVASNSDAVYVVEDYDKIYEHIDQLARGICEASDANKSSKEKRYYTCEPVLFYSFDLTCGSHVYDESRRGNDATVSGSFEFDDVTGKCKSKVMLSENGLISIKASNVKGKPVNALTIATWLTLYGDGKIHPIFSVVNSKKEGQYLLEVRPEGSIHFSLKFGDKVVCEMTTIDGIFPFNEWAHLAVTYSLKAEGKIYLNGKLLESMKMAYISERQVNILPGDWNGFVGIGKEKLDSSEKQLIGGVDEFYLFPCALDMNEIMSIRDFCSRFEPRTRPYAGTKYEIHAHPASSSVLDLKTELLSKTPTETKVLDLFEAPSFDNVTDTSIGTGQFAAKLSGYFVPPLEAEYTLTLSSNNQAALYMNPEKSSIQSEIQMQLNSNNAPSETTKRDYVIQLKSGVPYYIELYQLSSEKHNLLKLSFDVKCDKPKKSILKESPISNINAVYDIPRNCTAIRQSVPNAPDDEYMLRIQSLCQPVYIYCSNMAGSDTKDSHLEYLTLSAGPENNYAKFHRSRLINFNTCSGDEDPAPSKSEKDWGQTWFSRVRINPLNMAISRDDFTYSYKVGNNVRYGSGGDCYSKSTEDCRKGEFRINLNGTDMKVVGQPQWKATGSPAGMKERITRFKKCDDWKVISAHCGGSCSKCEPDGHIRLQPELCATQSASPAQTRDINSMKSHRKLNRNRKSVWSWWPW